MGVAEASCQPLGQAREQAPLEASSDGSTPAANLTADSGETLDHSHAGRLLPGSQPKFTILPSMRVTSNAKTGLRSHQLGEWSWCDLQLPSRGPVPQAEIPGCLSSQMAL